MKQKILNKNGVNAFWVIETLPDRPLFSDCPIRPPQETIDSAEELYLKLGDKPTYISVNNEQIIFEWHYYKPGKFANQKELYYSKELIIKDPINLEWREFRYG